MGTKHSSSNIGKLQIFFNNGNTTISDSSSYTFKYLRQINNYKPNYMIYQKMLLFNDLLFQGHTIDHQQSYDYFINNVTNNSFIWVVDNQIKHLLWTDPINCRTMIINYPNTDIIDTYGFTDIIEYIRQLSLNTNLICNNSIKKNKND